MNTPIHDFVKHYRDLRPARFHMPGHKGRGPLGCEDLDLTEIPGADSLYEASGIIAESEANASALFGCPTFYSTEGSSHCIRAMLLLAMQYVCRDKHCLSADSNEATGSRQQATGEDPVGGGVLRSEASPLGDAPQLPGSDTFGASRTPPPTEIGRRFRVLAARNVHRAFLSAAALLDLDVVWLPSEEGSYLSAHPNPEALDAALAESGAAAVYLSCPDYLGFLPDLKPLAAVCHARGALLLVDNAHGAYLRFLSPSRHPMDLGADLCCDSAHKTLPVLTGGAYLHVSQALIGATETSSACRGGGPASRPVEGCRPPEATGTEMQNDSAFSAESPVGSRGKSRTAMPEATSHAFGGLCKMQNEDVRDALALFGSTSPSYLILQSLDLANPWLETLPEKLADFLPKVDALKERLRAAGWTLTGDEPLKLTLDLSSVGTSIACPPSGLALAAALEQAGIFCEFADPDYIVFMLSPEHTEEELERLEAALIIRKPGGFSPRAGGQWPPLRTVPEAVCTLRAAMLSPAETVPASESRGRVLARPGVSCPPAVPILMPGEIIDEAAAAALEAYESTRFPSCSDIF